MELTVSLDTLCRIVIRAREYEALVPPVDEDDGSNPTDDKDVAVLDEDENTSVEEELRAAIDDLAEDEQAELIALTLVGRGTYEAGEWDEALEVANDETANAADFLLDLPMLAAYLDAGMAAFDINCDDIGQVG